MADYYPLLAKAVAKLTEATPEARQEIYERARKALAGQLRNLDPPVPEEAIAREAQALEIAVAQVEMDVAAESFPQIALPAGKTDFSGMRPQTGAPPHESLAQAAQGQAGIVSARRGGGPQMPPKALPLKVRRKGGEKRAKKAADKSAFLTAESPAAGPDPRCVSERLAPQHEAIDAADLSGPPASEDKATRPPIMARGALLPSFAPGSGHDQTQPKRLIAVFGIIAAVVVGIAIAAYRLRDRPEDLMRLQPQLLQGEAASGNKIADRVDRNSDAERGPVPPDGPSDAERKVASQAAAPLPAAHRAALLVEAKDGANRVETYIGRVIWRRESVSSGPDEPLRTAVRAEIEIPEIKFQANLIIQRNSDSTLPASHTVKLNFALADGSPIGKIRQISALQMRQEDTPVGDTLEGITVPIAEDSFLIGLARGAAEESNLERLRSREWLDVPMALANGLSAKLTLEKGPSGQRIFDDAIAAWRGQ
jgi:hypothetical protein